MARLGGASSPTPDFSLAYVFAHSVDPIGHFLCRRSVLSIFDTQGGDSDRVTVLSRNSLTPDSSVLERRKSRSVDWRSSWRPPRLRQKTKTNTDRLRWQRAIQTAINCTQCPVVWLCWTDRQRGASNWQTSGPICSSDREGPSVRVRPAGCHGDYGVEQTSLVAAGADRPAAVGILRILGISLVV